ncbi:MAG: hypothetical protein GX286_08055, partial [Clostridiales bacterium]|nr:hypothetical protein [Clostridiales bacterium]
MMRKNNNFTKGLSIIIVCAFALANIFVNRIKPEYISAIDLMQMHTEQYDIIIKGNSNSKKEPIFLSSAGTYNITLENVTLDFSLQEMYAFYLHSGVNVNLTLIGENTLISGGEYAGIHLSYNSSLTIDGSGSLWVKGGNSEGKGGAGIGGSFGYFNGTVKINGGRIKAEGGYYSAGIGGSNNYGGNIEINGGIIEAIGGFGAAGIGGGYKSRGGNIEINGGVITATAGSNAYDIGAGAEFTGTKGSTIIIGGSVNNTTDTIYFGNAKNMFRFDIHIPDCVNRSIDIMEITGYSYGFEDIYTDSKGIIYIWLPKEFDKQDINIWIDGAIYTGTLNIDGIAKMTRLESEHNEIEPQVTTEDIEDTTSVIETETPLEETESTISEITTVDFETTLEEVETTISEVPSE